MCVPAALSSTPSEERTRLHSRHPCRAGSLRAARGNCGLVPGRRAFCSQAHSRCGTVCAETPGRPGVFFWLQQRGARREAPKGREPGRGSEKKRDRCRGASYAGIFAAAVGLAGGSPARLREWFIFFSRGGGLPQLGA